MMILLIVVLYFGLLMLIAFLTGRHSTRASFFTGDRRSPWVVVAIGMIGASLSGVSFVSVPGMVQRVDMTYMQTVMGFTLGYIVVAHVLLPVYYRMGLTSIYTFLKIRFGRIAYKCGSVLFILSKLIGAAVRLYLVVNILDRFVLSEWGIPFYVTALLAIVLIWLYTYQSGIKTIVWTDMLQTLLMVASLVCILLVLVEKMGIGGGEVIDLVVHSDYSRIFVWDDWMDKNHFVKQFLSGCFITIVMSGLDQDMMQKNLTCRSLADAQKNMYSYGISFLPMNLLFLSIGVLLVEFAFRFGIVLPASGDDILPMLATEGHLGLVMLVLFTIGIIAAAFSSADSALTALTTTICIDLFEIERFTESRAKRLRLLTHLGVSAAVILFMLFFREVNSRSVIDAIYMIAGYTYGPLLGLFALGLFTNRRVWDRAVPFICIASPLLCFAAESLLMYFFNYPLGYELLMLNGAFTALLLYLSGVIYPPSEYKQG